MPSLKTYHDDKNIYSVDMMLAYLNTKGHPTETVTLESLKPQLETNVWGTHSPLDVVENMTKKKYSENAERINKADLSYPIIIYGRRNPIIVDGYHRAAKALLNKQPTLKAHIFDTPLMNKFILDKHLDYVKVHQHMPVSTVLELWSKRFNK